jgi:hypothetical protein
MGGLEKSAPKMPLPTKPASSPAMTSFHKGCRMTRFLSLDLILVARLFSCAVGA